jgi:sec-independent protein translocase protein TatA
MTPAPRAREYEPDRRRHARARRDQRTSRAPTDVQLPLASRPVARAASALPKNLGYRPRWWGRALAWSEVGIESPVHLLFLGAVALMVLGPKRLPELARALGKGVREFREAIDLKSHDDEH